MKFPYTLVKVSGYYYQIARVAASAATLCMLAAVLVIAPVAATASDMPVGGMTIHLPRYDRNQHTGNQLYRQGLRQFREGHPGRAAQLWRLLAVDGNRNAQFALGELYASGDAQAGIDQNLAVAAKWYRRAAEQGHIKAQYNLGVFYASGTGVPHDMHEAARWWRLAALQGHLLAQFDLGLLYAQGAGVQPNAAAAVRWWGMAAEHGYAPAEFNLGLMYIMGEGVKENRTEAVRLWQMSAKQGFGQAIHALQTLQDGR